MTQNWIPSMNKDRHASADAFQAWFSDMLNNYRSSVPRDSDANVAASSNQEIKMTSYDLLPSDEEGDAHQSLSSVHPVPSRDEGSIDKDGWIEEDGWKVKREMYGNVLDAYCLHEFP